MFGYSQLLPSRFKVAVTAATAVGEPSLVVFSNYNGICPQDYGTCTETTPLTTELIYFL